MQRRRLIQATIALAAVGLAGCAGGGSGSSGDGDGGGPGSPGDGNDGSPGDGDGGDTGDGDGGDPGDGNGSPGEPATSFEVTASRCGNQANRAEVTFGDGTVDVEGTIWGNDSCYTGHLESATLDGGTLTLRVVAVSEAEEGESCAQCITEIEYRASVETPSTPDEVVVIHDGETVATASP